MINHNCRLSEELWGGWGKNKRKRKNKREKEEKKGVAEFSKQRIWVEQCQVQNQFQSANFKGKTDLRRFVATATVFALNSWISGQPHIHFIM